MRKKSQNDTFYAFLCSLDPRTPVKLQMVLGILLSFRFFGIHTRKSLSIEMTKREHKLALRFIESVVLIVSFDDFLEAMFFIICGDRKKPPLPLILLKILTQHAIRTRFTLRANL